MRHLKRRNVERVGSSLIQRPVSSHQKGCELCLARVVGSAHRQNRLLLFCTLGFVAAGFFASGWSDIVFFVFVKRQYLGPEQSSQINCLGVRVVPTIALSKFRVLLSTA